jgi:hypothetical protein
VLAVPYFVDDTIYGSGRRTPGPPVYDEPVRVTLYRRGLPPLVIERVFREFSNF